MTVDLKTHFSVIFHLDLPGLQIGFAFNSIGNDARVFFFTRNPAQIRIIVIENDISFRADAAKDRGFFFIHAHSVLEPCEVGFSDVGQNSDGRLGDCREPFYFSRIVGPQFNDQRFVIGLQPQDGQGNTVLIV